MINTKIIKIASNTKYESLKNIYTHKSNVKNSICGDKIELQLIANKSKIKSLRYETESCVFCEASASLLAKSIRFYLIKDLKKDIMTLKSTILKKNQKFPTKFKEFKHLLNSKYLSRTNCVMLPLNALLKAFKK